MAAQSLERGKGKEDEGGKGTAARGEMKEKKEGRCGGGDDGRRRREMHV